ncbi:hypothetical protein SELMODRAFT_413086 [Selaginella moellendorffii]|uniref:Uncharacterized protein n=1 Tax=Selaginella moellendorffii TaxID=88036 RepID=D8RNA5_SELML|nr:hypothetical protein SELMODRAFT_413086 [Selaginella moellendorffii]
MQKEQKHKVDTLVQLSLVEVVNWHCRSCPFERSGSLGKENGENLILEINYCTVNVGVTRNHNVLGMEHVLLRGNTHAALFIFCNMHLTLRRETCTSVRKKKLRLQRRLQNDLPGTCTPTVERRDRRDEGTPANAPASATSCVNSRPLGHLVNSTLVTPVCGTTGVAYDRDLLPDQTGEARGPQNKELGITLSGKQARLLLQFVLPLGSTPAKVVHQASFFLCAVMYGWLSTQAADYILRGVFHEFGHVWIAVVAYVVKPEWFPSGWGESPLTISEYWSMHRPSVVCSGSKGKKLSQRSQAEDGFIAPPMFSRLAGKCNTLTVCETRMKHEVRNQLARIQRSRGERCLKAIESRRFVAVKNFGDLAKFVGDTDKAWFVIQKYGNTDWASLSELEARLLSQAFFELAIHRLWSGCEELEQTQIRQGRGSSSVIHDPSAYEVAWSSYTSAVSPLDNKDVWGIGPAHTEAAEVLEKVFLFINYVHLYEQQIRELVDNISSKRERRNGAEPYLQAGRWDNLGIRRS